MKLTTTVLALALANAANTLLAQTTLNWSPNKSDMASYYSYNSDSPNDSWYNFNYFVDATHGNWISKVNPIEKTDPADTHSLDFITNTTPYWNVQVTAPITLSGNTTWGSGCFKVTSGETITLAGSPITLLSKTSSPAIYTESNGALMSYVEFRNDVAIRAIDNGATSGYNITGVNLFVGGAGSKLIFDNLVIGNPTQGGATGITNVLVSTGQGAIMVNKLSDFAVGNTGQFTVSRVGVPIFIGDTSAFSGTIALYAGATITITKSLGLNLKYILDQGDLVFAPQNGETISIPISVARNKGSGVDGGDHGQYYIIAGTGSVIVTDTGNLTGITTFGFLRDAARNMTIGGQFKNEFGVPCDSTVLLGGKIDFQVSNNQKGAQGGIVVEKGGGFTNGAGEMFFDCALDLSNLQAVQTGLHNHLFTFSSITWYPVNITGRNTTWSVGGGKGIVLGDDYSYTNFQFDGKGLFTDGSRWTLFNSTYSISGSVYNGAEGWFDLGGGYLGQLEILDGTDYNSSVGQRLVLNVAAIPEPAAFALLGVSLLMVTVLRRRK